MLRRGKEQGWLSLPTSSARTWAAYNGVLLRGIDIGLLPGQYGRGSAIKVVSSTSDPNQNPLMAVPAELILSKENVHLHAKSDKHLREALDAVGDFGRTTRGAILLFLLVQITHSCPDAPEKIGLPCAFTDYIKYLPMELLPTVWTEEEVKLLNGTSLPAAIQTKVKSLYKEFDYLRDSTSHIAWCERVWWNETHGLLSFDDWKQVDAMYRSRALEFPGVGDAMVPCLDMANHASGDDTMALYESDGDGNALLLLREGKILNRGDEVTITYGDAKGACEMLFTYGFIESNMDTARDILLSLDVPDDDPLKQAKKMVANCAPGVRLFDSGGSLQWESDFVWLICVNEEDGLAFRVVQTTDGGQELTAEWKDEELRDASKLNLYLQRDPLWDVFHLRAVSILQERIDKQLRILFGDEAQAGSSTVRPGPAALATKLKDLEIDLLERFYEFMEDEKMRLATTDSVRLYLANTNEAEGATNDFS